MTAHVVFPAVDDLPATISRRFLGGLLRTELGFGGVIVTDALGMAAISDGVGSAEGAVRSLAAGADLLCLPADPAAQQQAREALARAIRDGDLPGGRVPEAAARVRTLAAWAQTQPATRAGPEVGAAAARRALLVGQPNSWRLPLSGPPYVLDAGGPAAPARRAAGAGARRGRDPAHRARAGLRADRAGRRAAAGGRGPRRAPAPLAGRADRPGAGQAAGRGCGRYRHRARPDARPRPLPWHQGSRGGPA